MYIYIYNIMLQFRMIVKNPMEIKTTPIQKTYLNQTDLNMIKERLDKMQNMQNYRSSITTNMLGRLQGPVQGCRTCGMLK